MFYLTTQRIYDLQCSQPLGGDQNIVASLLWIIFIYIVKYNQQDCAASLRETGLLCTYKVFIGDFFKKLE